MSPTPKSLIAASIILTAVLNSHAKSVEDYFMANMNSKTISLMSDHNNVDVYGLSQIGIFFATPGLLNKNTSCPDPILLSREGEELGRIYAIAVADDADNASCEVIQWSAMDDLYDDEPQDPDKMIGGMIGCCFSYSRYIGDPGNYLLQIPDGFFKLKDELLEGTTLEYTLLPAWTSEPLPQTENLTPEDLNSFSVTYLGRVTSAKAGSRNPYFPSNGKVSILFNGVDVTSNYYATWNSNTVTFTANEPIAEYGVLEVSLEHGCYCFNNSFQSPPVEFTLEARNNTSGLAEIVENPENPTLFSITGQKLTSIPVKGIYISNRKKILIK